MNRTGVLIGGIYVLLATIAGVQHVEARKEPQLVVHGTSSDMPGNTRSAPATPSKLTTYPFTPPKEVANNPGSPVLIYGCATASWFSLAEGKNYKDDSLRVRMTDHRTNGRQDSVTLDVTLGQELAMPGMIISTYATARDSGKVATADKTLLTQLGRGQHRTFVLQTEHYFPGLQNGITYFTFCLN
jgi:hypothetical protein